MSRPNVSKQFHQLPMFMTAQELKNDLTPSDIYYYKNASELWDAKLREAKKPNVGERSLLESIRSEGIHTPVRVNHYESGSVLGNGHHRVAVANHLDPNYLVPVLHGGWKSFL